MLQFHLVLVGFNSAFKTRLLCPVFLDTISFLGNVNNFKLLGYMNFYIQYIDICFYDRYYIVLSLKRGKLQCI